MRRFLTGAIVLSLFANGSAANAQNFKKDETVYFKYFDQWREARVARDEKPGEGGVTVLIKNALTGQWDGDSRWEADAELHRERPPDFDPEGYGNSDKGMQGQIKDAQFQPGQLVNFQHGGAPQDGVVVRQDKDGVLVKFRNWATGKFDGDFQAYYPANALKLGAIQQGAPNVAVNPQPQPNPAANPQPNPAANPQPNPAANPQPAQWQPGQGFEPPLNLLPQVNPGAALTANEVLKFLDEKLGPDPFAPGDAVRQTVFKELEAMAMKRGVNFTYDVNKGMQDPFYGPFMKYGAPNSVKDALKENLGVPVQNLDFFHGNFVTSVTPTGNPQDTTIDGQLRIGPNNTYTWQYGEQTLEGRWREATELEMNQSHKGGKGVVLLDAKSGRDWIVYEDDGDGDGAGKNNIYVADLKERKSPERATKLP